MRTTTQLTDFLRDPEGCQFLGKNFAYWCPRRTLTGFAVWGHPDRSDIRHLNAVMDVVLPPFGRPHHSLVDMSALGAVDPRAFREMADYLAKRWDAFGNLILRQALIRPNNFAGAIVAGFYEVVTPNYPVKIFDSIEPATAWLDITGETDFIAAVTSTRAAARDIDPVVRQLRSLLCEESGWPRLSDLAKRMGLSERSMQRRLGAARTSFHAEVHTAKLDSAQTLMLAGGISLTQIALELGFASLQHFSSLFRKRHGQSPTQWLRRRGTADAGTLPVASS